MKYEHVAARCLHFTYLLVPSPARVAGCVLYHQSFVFVCPARMASSPLSSPVLSIALLQAIMPDVVHSSLSLAPGISHFHLCLFHRISLIQNIFSCICFIDVLERYLEWLYTDLLTWTYCFDMWFEGICFSVLSYYVILVFFLSQNSFSKT